MRSEEEAALCCSKRHRVGFFFEEKEKNLGMTQKWIMTT
jgi:hypothetical protein